MNKPFLIFIFSFLTSSFSFAQTNIKQDSLPHKLQYPTFKKSNYNKSENKNSLAKSKNQADYILDSVALANKKLKYTQGFRILVYTGFDKKQANTAKETLYKSLGNVEIYTIFKQPTYKVKLGDFNNWLDANFILNTKVIQNFPSALIVPDLINITYK